MHTNPEYFVIIVESVVSPLSGPKICPAVFTSDILQTYVDNERKYNETVVESLSSVFKHGSLIQTNT